MAKRSSLPTPIGISSFTHLFEPRAPAENRDPRFSVNVILSPEAQKLPEWTAIKRAVLDVAKDRFGEQAGQLIQQGSLRLPWRSATDKDYDGYKGTPDGTIFINPWSQQKPGVIDGRLQPIIDPSDVWAGQLVRVTVTPFAYENSGNRGVGLSLNNVQIVKKDMPRLDGRLPAEAEFDAVDGDEPETAMADDEIPF